MFSYHVGNNNHFSSLKGLFFKRCKYYPTRNSHSHVVVFTVTDCMVSCDP